MPARTTGMLPASECWRTLGLVIVACDVCGATWAGWDGEACDWCARREAEQRDDQRRMLLAGPQGGDASTWRTSVLLAYDAGIIDRTEATNALLWRDSEA